MKYFDHIGDPSARSGGKVQGAGRRAVGKLPVQATLPLVEGTGKYRGALIPTRVAYTLDFAFLERR
jgi:hypothetical protein